MTEAPSRFRALDGWRGIAALFIALHHFPMAGGLHDQPLILNAWMFVDFFFVLSGFVLTRAYAERFAQAAETKAFTARRFFRLWPLHVATLVTLVAFETYRYMATGAGFVGERSFYALASNIALIQALGLHDSLTWNTPAWAVSTEFWVSILFAVAVFISGRFRILTAALLVTLSILCLALFSRYGMRETFDWGFARCVYGFFLGSLAHELHARGFARWKGNGVEIAGFLLALLFLIFIPGHRSLEYLATPVFAIFVLAFAGDAGLLSRAMAMPVFQRLGEWSYAIYLVQLPIIVAIVSALDAFEPGHTTLAPQGETIALGSPLANDALMLAYLVAVVGIAAMAWRMIEVPGQKLIQLFSQRQPSQPRGIG